MKLKIPKGTLWTLNFICGQLVSVGKWRFFWTTLNLDIKTKNTKKLDSVLPGFLNRERLSGSCHERLSGSGHERLSGSGHERLSGSCHPWFRLSGSCHERLLSSLIPTGRIETENSSRLRLPYGCDFLFVGNL